MLWGSKTGAAIVLGVTAAAGLSLSQAAQAADLGGNCCADLEERIAELEATTARKGNRKVSLEINGFVNEALFFFDDGVESNTYIGTNHLEQSRINFVGKAKIAGDWTAGYRLELGFSPAQSSNFNQETDDPGDTIAVRQSNWFLQSKTYGKVTLGRQATATYHLLNDTNFTLSRRSGVAEAPIVAFNGFYLRDGGNFLAGPSGTNNRLTWGGIQPGTQNDTYGTNGLRDVIRYDSPEFAGFSFAASWGEDDQAGAALIYQNTLGDFKVAGRVGYEQTTDETPSSESACSVSPTTSVRGTDCWWWGISGAVQHEPTGLFVYGSYGEQTDDAEKDLHPGVENKDSLWYVQAGIERKYFEVGKTNIFADYRHDDRGANSAVVGSANSFQVGDVLGGDLDFWGVGIVQSVDAAALQLYVTYRHAEGELTRQGLGTTDLDDIDLVITGARIQF